MTCYIPFLNKDMIEFISAREGITYDGKEDVEFIEYYDKRKKTDKIHSFKNDIENVLMHIYPSKITPRN